MTRNRILFLGVIVAIVAGMSLLYYSQYKQTPNEGSTNTAVATGENKLETQEVPQDWTHFVGTIKSVSGDTILVTLEYQVEEDPSLRERTVSVSSETVITQHTERDPEVMKREMESFMREMEGYRKREEADTESEQNPPVPPIPFESRKIGVGDLEIGQRVNILAGAGVKTEKTFTATSIDVLPPIPKPEILPEG